MPWLGPVKEPESFEEELVEAMDSEFMFGSFPGFEVGVVSLKHLLEEYGVQASSKTGQAVFQEYVTHALEEYYGDFERWTECGKCGTQFQPEHSLAYVNHLLADRVPICADCADAPESAHPR